LTKLERMNMVYKTSLGELAFGVTGMKVGGPDHMAIQF
jgi:hypothetical protein